MWPACSFVDPSLVRRCFHIAMAKRMHRIHGNPGVIPARAAKARKREERQRAEAEAQRQAKLSSTIDCMLKQLTR